MEFIDINDFCSFEVDEWTDYYDWIEHIHITNQRGEVVLDAGPFTYKPGGHRDNTHMVIECEEGDVLTISVTVNTEYDYYIQNLSWGHTLYTPNLVTVEDLYSDECPYTHTYEWIVPRAPGIHLVSWWQHNWMYMSGCGSYSYAERHSYTLKIKEPAMMGETNVEGIAPSIWANIATIQTEPYKVGYIRRLPDLDWDNAFINRLTGSGYEVKELEEGYLHTYDLSDTDLLVIGVAGANSPSPHPDASTLQTLDVPVIAMCRAVTQGVYEMHSSPTSNSGVTTFRVVDWEHVITQNLPSNVTIASSATVQAIRFLTTGTKLLMDNNNANTAGIAERIRTVGGKSFPVIFWGFFRGDLLNATGWNLFDSVVNYAMRGSSDIYGEGLAPNIVTNTVNSEDYCDFSTNTKGECWIGHVYVTDVKDRPLVSAGPYTEQVLGQIRDNTSKAIVCNPYDLIKIDIQVDGTHNHYGYYLSFGHDFLIPGSLAREKNLTIITGALPQIYSHTWQVPPKPGSYLISWWIVTHYLSGSRDYSDGCTVGQFTLGERHDYTIIVKDNFWIGSVACEGLAPTLDVRPTHVTISPPTGEIELVGNACYLRDVLYIHSYGGPGSIVDDPFYELFGYMGFRVTHLDGIWYDTEIEAACQETDFDLIFIAARWNAITEDLDTIEFLQHVNIPIIMSCGFTAKDIFSLGGGATGTSQVSNFVVQDFNHQITEGLLETVNIGETIETHTIFSLDHTPKVHLIMSSVYTWRAGIAEVVNPESDAVRIFWGYHRGWALSSDGEALFVKTVDYALSDVVQVAEFSVGGIAPVVSADYYAEPNCADISIELLNPFVVGNATLLYPPIAELKSEGLDLSKLIVRRHENIYLQIDLRDYCGITDPNPNNVYISSILIKNQNNEVLLDAGPYSAHPESWRDNTEHIIRTIAGETLTITVAVGHNYESPANIRLYMGHSIDSDDLELSHLIHSETSMGYVHTYTWQVPNTEGAHLLSWIARYEQYGSLETFCGTISNSERQDYTLFIGTPPISVPYYIFIGDVGSGRNYKTLLPMLGGFLRVEDNKIEYQDRLSSGLLVSDVVISKKRFFIEFENMLVEDYDKWASQHNMKELREIEIVHQGQLTSVHIVDFIGNFYHDRKRTRGRWVYGQVGFELEEA